MADDSETWTSDEMIADAVRDAAKRLSMVLEVAANAGLTVELDMVDLTAYSDPAPLLSVSARIERRTVAVL